MHPSGAGSMRMSNSCARRMSRSDWGACFSSARMAFSRAAWTATLSVCTAMFAVVFTRQVRLTSGGLAGEGDFHRAQPAHPVRVFFSAG